MKHQSYQDFCSRAHGVCSSSIRVKRLKKTSALMAATGARQDRPSGWVGDVTNSAASYFRPGEPHSVAATPTDGGTSLASAGQIDLSLRLTKHHCINTYGEVKV
jgi:hypothetical protein